MLIAPTGEQFVLVSKRGWFDKFIISTFIKNTVEYGMVLDEKLCSNGMTIVKKGNFISVSLDSTYSSDKSITEDIPIGICFSRL